MYAIIETGGKQYRVAEGDVVTVERLAAEVGAEVVLLRVLAGSRQEGQLTGGHPEVPGAKALARGVEHGRGKKLIIFKYKSKVNYRRKTGHRQAFTRLRIEKIEG